MLAMFSPLGAKLYFHVNSWRKNYIVLPPIWPPCHVVANQEYVNQAPQDESEFNNSDWQ